MHPTQQPNNWVAPGGEESCRRNPALQTQTSQKETKPRAYETDDEGGRAGGTRLAGRRAIASLAGRLQPLSHLQRNPKDTTVCLVPSPAMSCPERIGADPLYVLLPAETSSLPLTRFISELPQHDPLTANSLHLCNVACMFMLWVACIDACGAEL